MSTGPRESDVGTGKAGPLERAPRKTPSTKDDPNWITDRDQPYIQRHAITGRVRTHGYSPDKPLKD